MDEVVWIQTFISGHRVRLVLSGSPTRSEIRRLERFFALAVETMREDAREIDSRREEEE